MKEKEAIKIITSGQYIKDLSFENPLAPKIYTEKKVTPQISVSIDINGTNDKKNLRYMGYFHGYKGYRYHNNPSVLTR